MNNLGEKLRILREKNGLLLRQVAASLEVDTGYLSKLERGEKNIRKEHVIKLAELYKAETNDLITMWLSEKVMEVVHDEPEAHKALQIAIKNISLSK